MELILTALIAFASIMVPGFFLALALLKKTKLNMFEISVIGFIFGLVFPPTLTWFESYFINYIHFFSFSAELYIANVVFLTIAGIALSVWQGVIDLSFLRGMTSREIKSTMEKDYRGRLLELRNTISMLNSDLTLVKKHEREEEDLARSHAEEAKKIAGMAPEEMARILAMHLGEEKRLMEEHEREERMLIAGTGEKKEFKVNPIYLALIFLMVFAFATRMMSIGIVPSFFQFDSYFDMQSTEFILTHGYQWLNDHSAWPTAANGTAHRIEPIVPYLEAYWYEISSPPANQIDHTLLNNVSSVYPPIVGALLVFIVFLFLDHTYGKLPAIIGAALATAMPALISTSLAGQQLLQPWGIFSMFLFYATYLLAAQNTKEWRFAVLAGISFSASFLGAHYYTVIAGVFAIYVALQGVIDILRKKDMKDFYRMNVIVLGVIAIFFLIFEPYQSVLTGRIPGVLGIPVIIAFPLISLLSVFLFENGPLLAQKYRLVKKVDLSVQLAWLVAIGAIGLLLVLLTPLGNSVRGYITLSTHFTTPSSALFMTVQEYAPTGLNFDFGSAGFGPIGASFFGVNASIWLVLIVFFIFAALAVYHRDSKASILSLAAIGPLAFASMTLIKYMPHFGVGYIIAFCSILGELLLLVKDSKKELASNMILGFGVFVILLESIIFINMFSAVGASCSQISSQGNGMGFTLFCNTVPKAWLDASAWMEQNVGPYAPRILSWWDYGDWINWFGNSNAVLRGDNSMAKLDYMTAARYVLGEKDGFGPSNLTSYMNDVVQSKYVLFDDQLTQKWQALNFLACVDTNQTSRAYAMQQGNGTSAPYVLGTSQCELTHTPAYIMLPLNTNNINNYCQIPNSTVAALRSLLLVGNGFSNQTLCVPLNVSDGPTRVMNSNGTETNMLLIPNGQFFAGTATIGGQQFANFMVLYLPNGPNNTVTNAPTKFYDSNYYRAFYLGSLPGFKVVYPQNFKGMNYVNGTWPVVIYQVDNYTGTLPTVTPKPAWVHNNFTMPG